MLAFSIDYYGVLFRATQSVGLFCTYLQFSFDFFHHLLNSFYLLIYLKNGRSTNFVLSPILILYHIKTYLLWLIGKNNHSLSSISIFINSSFVDTPIISIINCKLFIALPVALALATLLLAS